jgi:hypothetical protein
MPRILQGDNIPKRQGQGVLSRGDLLGGGGGSRSLKCQLCLHDYILTLRIFTSLHADLCAFMHGLHSCMLKFELVYIPDSGGGGHRWREGAHFGIE